MSWTIEEQQEVAAFYAKRFPENSPTQWEEVVRYAADTGTLSDLAHRMAQRDATDANLQQMVLLLDPPKASPAFKIAAAGIGLGTSIAGLGVGILLASVLTTPPAEAHMTASRDARPLPALQVSPPPVEPAFTIRDAAPAQDAPTEQPSETTDHDLQPQSRLPVIKPDTASLQPQSAPQKRVRCNRSEGTVVGYWYSGKSAPGLQGDVVTIERDLNVRTDYPDHHNDYDSRTTVQCVLRKGDKVRLSQAPLHVPGDYYWVPLVSGDLVGPV